MSVEVAKVARGIDWTPTIQSPQNNNLVAKITCVAVSGAVTPEVTDREQKVSLQATTIPARIVSVVRWFTVTGDRNRHTLRRARVTSVQRVRPGRDVGNRKRAVDVGHRAVGRLTVSPDP